jgi:hypothetical protein
MFANSTDKEIKRLWCDGVMMPFYDIELTRENVIKTKKIITTAWIGFDGQGKYDMIIKLGKNSIEACERNLNLTDCLPGDESLKWIVIDERQSKIELQLK